MHALRFSVILLAAFLVSFALPPIGWGASPGAIVPVFVLVSLLLGFFIDRAIERKQTINQKVAIELSRARRLFHLVENISDARFRKQIQSATVAYGQAVADQFLVHSKTSESFRALTHLIYGYAPKTKADDLLFSDLLQTTREMALERQQLEQALESGLTPSSWIVVLVSGAFASTLLLLSRFEGAFSPLGCAFVIATLLLALDLLWRTDRLSKSEIRRYSEQYRQNIASLVNELKVQNL